MIDQEKCTAKIVEIVVETLEENPDIQVKADSQLVGEAAIVSSRELVEILLAIEEYAEDDLKVEFDWASDSAMSGRRSMFRTPASLGEYLVSLAK
ncbi:MAG: hypothetical protein L3J13_09070 [Devosiaceae bacterium]|nr:hypothetical protein [Devosiaceae bacterium]